MRIASFRGEASVAELVARLFPSSSGESAERIARRLLKSNPHLADVKSLPPGAPIVLTDDLPQSDEAKGLNPFADLVAQRAAAPPRVIPEPPTQRAAPPSPKAATKPRLKRKPASKAAPPPKAKQSRRTSRKKK